MLYKDIAYALEEKQTLDELKRARVIYTRSLIYCNVSSITQSEFYQSAVAGYKPELKINTKLLDTSKITHIEYNGIKYKVVRVYRKEDAVELTLTSTLVENAKQ